MDPIEGIPCEECSGVDAEHCKVCLGTGFFTLYRCPNSVVPNWARSLLRLIYIAREGGPWPEAGGLLDQTAAFVDAYDIAVSELSKLDQITKD
ncbi:MAG: hypothetical protein AAF581_11255 [Planctomycetota bacterium]